MLASQSAAGLAIVLTLALAVPTSPATSQTMFQNAAPQPSTDTKQHVGDSGGDGAGALSRFAQHQQIDGQGGDGADALRAFSKQNAGGEGGSAALEQFTRTGHASE